MTAWTDERADALKMLWRDGLPASQIARRLNAGVVARDGCLIDADPLPEDVRLTRNAAISKARRLGLPYRTNLAIRHKRSTKTLSQVTGPSTEDKDAARRKALAEFEAAMVAGSSDPVATPEKLTILTRDQHGRLVANDALGYHHCRWPVGQPGTPDFHFCGQRRLPGVSYCEVHALRAFVPVPLPKLRIPGLAANTELGEKAGEPLQSRVEEHA